MGVFVKWRILVLSAFLCLAACGDDDSGVSARSSDDSSSSICEDCDDVRSPSSVIPGSSGNLRSSSSQKQGDGESLSSSSGQAPAAMTSSSAKSSSSSSAKSSSSSQKNDSSSSVSLQSSSSETSESSSSEVETSSSSDVLPLSNGTEYKRVQCDVKTDVNCIKDSRDGQTYKTVTIGTQTWMAENLNYETVDSYCYNDSAKYCAKYGSLYTWDAAMDSVGEWSTNGRGCGYYGDCSPTYPVRGVCPEGWHLPTMAEFEMLLKTVGGTQDKEKYWQWQGADMKLKSSSGWNDDDGDCGNGADSFGFSALPAGNGRSDGYYYDEGKKTIFWSSTESTSICAYGMYVGYGNNITKLDYGDKNYGFSVRCLKD